MEEYLIRYATRDDITKIMKFIDENWKKNHILSHDRKLFEWQYTSDKFDYVLGIDSGGNIQGMLGFISYDDTPERDIATSMWRAKPSCGFLGIKLLMFVLENEPHRILFSPGINVNTSGAIYRRMNIKMGQMKQWYRLRNVRSYKVASIVDGKVEDTKIEQNCKLVLYKNFEILCQKFKFDIYVKKESVPYKSKNYVRRRYFEHPIYNYLVYGVEKPNNDTVAVIVLRIQLCNETQVLRFIDCIGDTNVIGNITVELDNLMAKFSTEYIDMYEAGISDELLMNAGWTEVKKTENIIPNYFSPYTQCNVDINYCTTDENIVLFKGDGDQDRPN